MKPIRVFLTMVVFGGIAFAFGYFLITGNAAREHYPRLHGHPHLVLTDHATGKMLITWKAAWPTQSGLILYDTVSHRGDPSRYTYWMPAARSNEITTALPGERKPGPTENFIVELEGLNSLTTYYFVLKNNGEVSAEYHFITPPGRGD